MQIQNISKISAVLVFVFMAVVCHAADEVGTSTSKMFSSLRNSYEELYSENSYYEQYNLVTDTRLRHYQPLRDGGQWGLDAYIGANLQYQSPGAKQKYFDDALMPYVGLQANLMRKIFLQMQAGARSILNDNYEGNRTQWDPRIILSAGDFWQWKMPQVFTEGYGESAFVPRLDSTPVSTVWLKQGYRFKPVTSVNLDPYAEFYLRESRSADLGPSMTEFRLGLRTQWLAGGWNVAALIYHPFDRKDAHGDVEGLMVIGGVF